MKLDMANFTLQMARPDIIAHSVELERKKFSDFLAVQSDGLEHTKKWILKHIDPNEAPPSNSASYESFIRNLVKKASWEGFIDLLDWEEEEPYPEVGTTKLNLQHWYIFIIDVYDRWNPVKGFTKTNQSIDSSGNHFTRYFE